MLKCSTAEARAAFMKEVRHNVIVTCGGQRELCGNMTIVSARAQSLDKEDNEKICLQRCSLWRPLLRAVTAGGETKGRPAVEQPSMRSFAAVVISPEIGGLSLGRQSTQTHSTVAAS